MKNKRVTAFLLASLLIVLALVFATAALAAGGAPRVTTLSGAEEVPPADPDGSGYASIWLNAGQRTVCWEWSVEDIATPTAAHIHKAPAGQNGGVVVPLMPVPGEFSASGCATGVDKALIKDIIKNPHQYYVNVHNLEFPGGAVRGQLSNRGQSK